ncbi:hydroxyethylthiazole kinase [Breoghania sp.]|uniref:hydroxyethylthiazole kinase n=1 Tax=Breoghania sp. TaxID=2065378 RepID=UPI00261472E0|nr:hydroxyethylthiazole kinase [Breoghania sp.]MDJ0930168.1 hydroxyethylthiazole kinase [Breoghania sp.]
MITKSALPTLDDASSLCDVVRSQGPLVQNITNYVAMTLSANVLLAAGASPAMVHAEEEVADFVRIASALVVNIGTLSPSWVASMGKAVHAAVEDGKPWVLDPVGCGATPYRTETARSLALLKPTVIRGNASEIIALAGASGAAPKGVDSAVSSHAAVGPARVLSRQIGAVIAITGETDFVVDANVTAAVEGGDPLMTTSTGVGCALSALTGAYVASCNDPFVATVSAMAVYAVAGRIAARGAGGPGDVPIRLCNALNLIDAEALRANAEIHPHNPA